MALVNVERDERIAELTRQHYTAEEIARMVGVTARSVVRARARTGVTRPKAPLLTDSERERIEKLLDDGASYNEVARTVGRNLSCIRYNFPDRGWTAAQGTEFRTLLRTLERCG